MYQRLASSICFKENLQGSRESVRIQGSWEQTRKLCSSRGNGLVYRQDKERGRLAVSFVAVGTVGKESQVLMPS